MYIDDCTYTRGGKTYRRVLMRNSYRVDGVVRHDTIANLSHCRDDEITAMKLALKNKGQLEKLGTLNDCSSRQGLSVGAVWCFFQLAKQLGLIKIFGQSRNAMLSLWLVFAALIAQGSRLSAARLAQKHAVCDILNLDSFNEDDLYCAMDWLENQQDTIEQAMFANRYNNGEEAPNLFLYDVTSSYLEGDQNELAQYGYDRDKKKGKTQIVIGLLTDDVGRPISVEVFDGNTQDTQTVASQIEKLQKRFSVKQVTLVGDRGMLKSAQISVLNAVGFNYITAITKPQIKTLIKEGVIQLSLFDDKIMEVMDNGTRYVLRRNPVRALEIAKSREKKYKFLQDFVTDQNVYLAEHPRAKAEIALRKVNEKIGKFSFQEWVVPNIETNNNSTQQDDNIDLKNIDGNSGSENHDDNKEKSQRPYPENRILALTINDEKKQEQCLLDGCYVIKSDLSTEAASGDVIHSRYKDLAKVENAFRTMKTTLLEMRGIFVRKEKRTRSHVFIIMLAYLIAFELHSRWYDVEATVEEGIDELTSICSVHLDIAGQHHAQVIPEPRPLGKMLLEKLKITLPDAIPHKNVAVVARKTLVSERKSS